MDRIISPNPNITRLNEMPTQSHYLEEKKQFTKFYSIQPEGGYSRALGLTTGLSFHNATI